MAAEVDSLDVGRVRITFRKDAGEAPPCSELVSVAELADLVSSHVCERKRPRERVVDESRDPPISGIYPTCSVCGKPQVFPRNPPEQLRDV